MALLQNRNISDMQQRTQDRKRNRYRLPPDLEMDSQSYQELREFLTCFCIALTNLRSKADLNYKAPMVTSALAISTQREAIPLACSCLSSLSSGSSVTNIQEYHERTNQRRGKRMSDQLTIAYLHHCCHCLKLLHTELITDYHHTVILMNFAQMIL